MRKDTTSLVPEIGSVRRRRRLSAFRQPWRGLIARLSHQADAIEDLAESFPALLFALATGYGTAAQRRKTIAGVKAGQPLKTVAADLDLPLWLRRVPPCAFASRLPVIPTDAEFGHVMSNRLPSHAEDATVWFNRVLQALRVVGRDFAIWTARDSRAQLSTTNEEDFQWLVAWAWHASNPKAHGYELLRHPWSPAMSWKKAREEITVWRKRLDLAATLGSGIRDAWVTDGRVRGFDIVALRTARQFIAESIAMENCLDQYARHLIYGHVRVFSVRRKGRSVANLELTLHPDDVSVPGITQLRGPRNRRVSTQVWQAVYAWLGDQPFRAVACEPPDAATTRATLHALWQPYIEALQAVGVLEQLHPRQQPLNQHHRRPAAMAAMVMPVPVPRIVRRKD